MDRDSTDTSERLQRALREVSCLEKQLQEVAKSAGSAGDAQQLQAELATLRVEKTEPCWTWVSSKIFHHFPATYGFPIPPYSSYLWVSGPKMVGKDSNIAVI